MKHIINVTFLDNYFCFWAWINLSKLVLSSLSTFLNSKTNAVTSLEPFNLVFNLVNTSISLLLTEDSVSLSCSSGLKEFKISTLLELA